MAKFDVVDLDGKKLREIELSDAVFAAEPNPNLFYEVSKFQQINRRRGTVGVKNTSLVRGGGKKPYKQKGTGRAQAGSTRSPLWRHGGTIFGPQPRSYDYNLPKKVERGALRNALQFKLREGVVIVVDALKADEKKTKPTAALLKRLGATGSTLVVDVKPEENFTYSARNIAGVRVVASGKLTARDVMDTARIIATRAALERLQEVLG